MSTTSTPRSRMTILIAVFVLAAGAASIPLGGVQASEEQLETTSSDATVAHEDQEGPRDLVLEGNLTDAETGEPVQEAAIEISNRWFNTSDDGEVHAKGYDRFRVVSDADGHYAVNVSEGIIELRVDEPAYQRTHAEFEIDDNLTLDLTLKASDEDLATIEGVVTDENGAPLSEARVSVQPQHRTHCEGDVCYAESRAYASEGSEHVAETDSGEITIRYMPRDDRHVSTQTSDDGSYSMQVPAGNYTVRASASDHLPHQQPVQLAQGETATVDLALTPIPSDSVTVTGTVRDAETGEPIPHAEITVENDRWGSWDHVRSGEDGTFTVETKPGHAIVTIRADASYWVPCEREETPDHDEASDGGDAARAPAPPCDGRRERAHAYLATVGTYTPEAGDTIQPNASLERAPEPDASISGWVINASSEEGIPDATVGVRNEITGEWGRAEADENGSFQIPVREGYYTIRTHAPGHLSTATNVRVGAGEDVRVTLEAPPGQQRYGGCCIAYAESGDGAVAHETSVATRDAGGMASAESGAGAADASGPSGEGPQAFQGGAGHLGAYSTSAHTDDDPDGPPGQAPNPQTTPLVGVLGTLALLGLGAAALTVWSPRRR